MCIPHGASGSKSNGFVKEKRQPKSIKKPDEQMMKIGDPDFIDERISEYIPKDTRSLFTKFIDWLMTL